LIFRWQTYGASGWNKEGVAGKWTTYSSPAIAETSNSTVITYEGSGHSLIFRWQAYGSSIWNREVVAGKHNAYSAPSIAAGDIGNAIAVEGPNHSLDFYWQAHGAVQWTEEVVAGSGTTYSAPSLAQVSGVPGASGDVSDIFVEGPNHSLIDWNQNDYLAGGAWYENVIAGDNTTFSAPSGIDITESDYVLEVAYQGLNNSLKYSWAVAGTPSSSETVAGPGTTFSAPSLALGNNSTSIAAQGPNHSLEFYWQTIGGTVWGQESVNGSNSTYSAPSIGEGNNSTGITVEGHDHTLDFYWQTYGGSTGWNPEAAAGNWTTYA